MQGVIVSTRAGEREPGELVSSLKRVEFLVICHPPRIVAHKPAVDKVERETQSVRWLPDERGVNVSSVANTRIKLRVRI